MTTPINDSLIDTGKGFIRKREFTTDGGGSYSLLGKTVTYTREDGWKRELTFPTEHEAEKYFLIEFDLWN